MKIALIGNQNSGKTTLFNLLTGSNQKIGNWPGVTVEKKVGFLKSTQDEIVDLPGIYSLSPYTQEEDVSRNFLLTEKPDLIVNIIDATSLERSLYLTTQLMELDYPVVVALNMCDRLHKKGLTVNESKLSKELGIDVVKISALKKTGVESLENLIKNKKFKKFSKKIYEDKVENALLKIEANLDNKSNKKFSSVKILERDEKYTIESKKILNLDSIINEIETHYDMDTEELIANQRYNFIVKVKSNCVVKKESSVSITDKLDKIFLNKWLAIPIFVCIMGLVYFLSVGVVGMYTVDLIDGLFGSLSETTATWLEGLGASEWSVSLLCDGIIAGVGAVMNFVPQLIILFLCIALLETSGYMSRISFFFDKIFRKFGLSGKSLIPFIVGSGCSVPAIMTTRTIEDENEKRATIMLTPFIPCSAKLPIITLFAVHFFPTNLTWLVMLSLYLFAIIIIIFGAILLRKFVFKGNSTSFISELPEYKLPIFKYVLRDVFDKSWSFIKRAGTIILLCSVVIWILVSFNWKFEYGVAIEESILAWIGKSFSWVFYPILGTNSWAAAVSAIQGLVAKEQVISSMAVIAGLAEGASEATIFASSGIFSFFTPVSAYAFMVFNLFSAPCFGAIGAMHKEFGNAKHTWLAVIFQTGIAWVLASLVNLIGSLIAII